MRILALSLLIFLMHIVHGQQRDSSNIIPKGRAADVLTYDYFFQITNQGIDTSLASFAVFLPTETDSVPYGHLGPAGSAAYPLIDNHSLQNGIRSGWKNYQRYRREKENLRFAHSPFPFSDLYYAQGIYGLQIFKALFGMAPHPNLDLGFSLDALADNGYFQNQAHRDNSLDLHARYKWKQGRQITLGGYLLNDIKAEENGGLDTLLNPVEQVFRLPRSPRDAFVKLDATSRDRSHLFYLHHRMLLGRLEHLPDDSIGTFHPNGHELFIEANLESRKFEYIDRAPSPNYYPAFLLSPDSTHDLTEIRKWSGKGGWKYQKKEDDRTLRIAAFEKYEQKSFVQNGRLYPYKELSSHALAYFDLKKRLQFKASADWHNLGAAAGDRNLEFSIDGNILEGLAIGARAGFERSSVPFIYRHYLSNHYYWEKENDWQKSQYRYVALMTKLRPIGLRLEAKWSRVVNDLYFDQNAAPAQYAFPYSVWQVSARHQFHAGVFHLDTRIWYQYVPEEAPLNLPALVVRSKAYVAISLFEAEVPTVFGIEVRYHTPFEVPVYHPVLNQFGVQSRYTARSYPIIEPYAAMKIKTARLFARVSNADQAYPYIDSYEWVKDYPVFPLSFTFGVSWRFFN